MPDLVPPTDELIVQWALCRAEGGCTCDAPEPCGASEDWDSVAGEIVAALRQRHRLIRPPLPGEAAR